jgi:poly(3-hydroxybutyrate) depolymerase
VEDVTKRPRRRPSLPPIAVVIAIVAAPLRPAESAPQAPVSRAPRAPAAAPAPALAPGETARDAAERAELARLDAEARAPATDVRLAPSSDRGGLGAWLVAGPFRGAHADALPAGVEQRDLAPSLDAAVGDGDEDHGARKKSSPTRWRIASTREGNIDLKKLLGASGKDLVAFAGGALHVERAGTYLLLLGVDDGVRVIVDGETVYTRDEARPARDDDDLVPLDLAPGDHDVLLELHQRTGAWVFHARFVDRATLRPPLGAYLRLPGTSAADARALAGEMSLLSVDRAFDAASDPPRYAPKLTVRFPEGAPRGVPLPVSARLARASSSSSASSGADDVVFDVQAGGVPVSADGAGELAIALPPVAPFSSTLTLETTIAGRVVKSTFHPRPASEKALAHARAALAKLPASPPWLPDGSRVSVQLLADRLAALVARGDGDAGAQRDEARELDRLATALDKETDPYAGRTGAMRRAITSEIDGAPTEFGLYVPPWYEPGSSSSRTFPLIVGLHGLNGHAMSMLRWLFGGDDPKHQQGWEDRHMGDVPAVDAFIVTPLAHGNTLYRELGESDVMQIVRWAKATFPIDASRVTITGPSMGGIGSASIPLHFPHVFAGAMPLCGYHSYLIRHDVAGHPIRPWERFLAEERSNSLWAVNGEHLPLFIVHGTQDKPEANSGVLIDAYEKLKFSVHHEHPEAGHNVWQQTYEDLAGIKWLLRRRLDLHPSHVRFKTSRTRWSESAWVKVDELTRQETWGEIDARAHEGKVTLKTSGVAALTLARDEKLLPDGSPVEVTADGQALSFDASEPITLHREGSDWKKGAATHAGLYKHGRVTGPIRDVFYEPILFVYAAGDEARANEEVARAFARIRYGVSVKYPIVSDAEFFARGEPLANDRALFLVGRGNKVTAALQTSGAFPISVEAGAVTVGGQRFTGTELGAAFIRPNPARPDRYVVVVAGADVPGTLRAMSLPDLSPDFAVWDQNLARSRGRTLLDAGSLRAGGTFANDWSLPAEIGDPLARARRSAAGAGADGADGADGDDADADATPYLP